MTCEELLAMLNEYVDGDAAPGVCAAFEEHLAGCNPCQVVVDNIRGTIALYREGERYPLPQAFEARLHQSLRRHWQSGHGPGRARDVGTGG